MSGEEELWTLDQAIEFVAYGDVKRARKAPKHIPERDWRSETIIAWWSPVIVAAAQTLRDMLQDGVVVPIERDRPVKTDRWAGERLRQLAPDEPTAFGSFVKAMQRSFGTMRIPAGELMAALSEPAPVAAPDAPAKVTPAEAVEPAGVSRLGGQAWATAMLKEIRPNGLDKEDTYPVLRRELGGKGRWIGDATLKRALSDAGMSRRKRRSEPKVSQKLNRRRTKTN
jgi:hypothetical protein